MGGKRTPSAMASPPFTTANLMASTAVRETRVAIGMPAPPCVMDMRVCMVKSGFDTTGWAAHIAGFIEATA